GANSLLRRAIGSDWKGKLSPALYLAAVPAAFLSPRISQAIFILVAMLWLVPDRRIERILAERGPPREA
ncbi:MAG TPA: hypothetical protein VK437_09770, partial [Steroidobacteraceae bacterium]|nr:hypothetical protein [Steroidobacteraceae bacterium]